MTIQAVARIAHRIDSQTTERMAPVLPAGLSAGLAWATVDIKPDTAPGACPAWCREHLDTDPESSTFHTSPWASLDVCGGTRETHTISMAVEQIEDPGQPGPVIIRMDNSLMSPAEAREVASMLNVHAALADRDTASPISDVVTAYQLGRAAGAQYDLGKAAADRAWETAITGLAGGSAWRRLRWALRIAFRGAK
jgi:hypothetical protein